MANEKWIKDQVKLLRLKTENNDLAKQKGINIIRYENSHIELYNNKECLQKVLYSEGSLKFYLAGVK